MKKRSLPHRRNGTQIKPAAETQPRILVLDVGGTNVKARVTGMKEAIKIPSGLTFTPKQMISALKQALRDTPYDLVSIGFPAPVVHGRPISEPHNLGAGWVGFDFARALGRPVKIINDAAMQALGSYKKGSMLFLGLGTGLGSAMVVEGVVEPMELAHMPYKQGRTFEDYAGLRGLKALGRKKWERQVSKMVERLQHALEPEEIVLGGGNSKKLKKLPRGTRLGDNRMAFVGGCKLWSAERDPRRFRR
jgi:predicted NBD/HSP70 family sugar kinase